MNTFIEKNNRYRKLEIQIDMLRDRYKAMTGEKRRDKKNKENECSVICGRLKQIYLMYIAHNMTHSLLLIFFSFLKLQLYVIGFNL